MRAEPPCGVFRLTRAQGTGTNDGGEATPGSAVPLEIDLQIEPEPEALSDARRSLDDLEDSMAPKSLEHVRLLTSELLTNSVRHASLDSGERIGLRVVASPERVRVEVSRLSAPPYEEMRNYHLGA